MPNKKSESIAASIDAMKSKLERLKSKGNEVVAGIKHVTEKLNEAEKQYAEAIANETKEPSKEE